MKMLLVEASPTSSRMTRVGTRIGSWSLLEDVLQRELHHARVGADRQDFSERRAAQVRDRVALYEPVERVERLHAHLDLVLGGQRELPDQREIDRLPAGAEVGVASRV